MTKYRIIIDTEEDPWKVAGPIIQALVDNGIGHSMKAEEVREDD